ncbi:MAG: hypothetical protein V4649_17045 [Bacteroidota bacterium]
MTTKITAAALLSLSLSISSSAQHIHQHIHTSNVHIGLAYPLSTNGVHAAEYTNKFSLHAISGVSYSESAFCASGVVSVIRDSARGFVGSGFANIIGNNTTGMQGAGFINYTRNHVTGLQAAGFINVAGAVHGVQLGGFANVLTSTAMPADSASGTLAKDEATTQVAGFVNVADSATAQIAGFVNVARNTGGAQVAGFINIANDVDGAQVAGFINVAHKVKGVQLSGFINIADSSDYPIGIINLIKNGQRALGTMVDETGTTFVTFRSGGRKLYGVLAAGYNGSRSRSIYACQAGLGAHLFNAGKFTLSAEGITTFLTGFRQHSDMQSSIRMVPSVRFGRVEVYAGPSFSYALSYGPGGAPFDHRAFWSDKSYWHTHELYIGAVAGLQVHF